jgi:ankyrin repeat protein
MSHIFRRSRKKLRKGGKIDYNLRDAHHMYTETYHREKQPMEWQLLYDAIVNDDYNVVDEYIEAGGFIDITDMTLGYTPLQWAIIHKASMKIIKKLVEAGANIEDEDGWEQISALGLAHYYGSKELFDYLKRECHKNKGGECKYSVKKPMINYGKGITRKNLLKRKKIYNHINGKLMYEQYKSSQPTQLENPVQQIQPIQEIKTVTNSLLLTKVPKIAKPAAHSAKHFKKPTASDMFLDYVASGNAKLVEEYLDKNGDVKVRNCKGESALHIAAAHNQNDILEMLLPYFNEDELDIRDMYGLPPYMTAIKYENDLGARIISDYRNSIKTKPYRFKNYNFANNNNSIKLDNLIINGDKITSKINQASLNKITKQLVNISKNKSLKKNKISRELKKLNWTMKNKTPKPEENLNTKLKRIVSELMKNKQKTKKVSKKRSEKNQLNEIERIQRIENLPEELQYLPKGSVKLINQIPGYNNTQSKQIMFNNGIKTKKRKA